jgi:hypothetical protein
VGVIEFGRAYNIYENVVHATREGVRSAVADCITGGNCTPGNATTLSDSQIKSRIRGQLRSINIDVASDSDIIIDRDTPLVIDGLKNDPSIPGSSTHSQNFKVFNVRVNYTYNFLFLGPVVGLMSPGSSVGSQGVLVSATVEMIDENV